MVIILLLLPLNSHNWIMFRNRNNHVVTLPLLCKSTSLLLIESMAKDAADVSLLSVSGPVCVAVAGLSVT